MVGVGADELSIHNFLQEMVYARASTMDGAERGRFCGSIRTLGGARQARHDRDLESAKLAREQDV